MTPILEVAGLAVRYGGAVDALRGVSFSLERGESIAVVGESGAGKSTLALCLAGLVQPPEASGSVRLGGEELLGAGAEALRALRWESVALALQGAPFNPVVTIGAQVAEPLRDRRGLSKSEARLRAASLCEEVGLDPALLDRYPHQLSGGERRRALLAMVLALDPQVVVLDEPTAGLDLATAADVVERIRALADARGFSMVVVSHNLPDATRLAARTMVLYAGEAMETGASTAVIGDPVHPYTWALVNAFPVMTTTKDLHPIRGLAPDPRAVPAGCPFHPRCTQVEDVCVQSHPELAPGSSGRLVACHFGGVKTLLQATDLHKSFSSTPNASRGYPVVAALRGVSLYLREGEALGIVGPSGSGKSTLARVLTAHLAPDSGQVVVDGQALIASWRSGDRKLRRRVQLVMQDPADALSPRLCVRELVQESLDLSKNGSAPEERHAAVAAALTSVGLPSSGAFLAAHTHELSGGQLQRVALARALAARPKLLVADEPTAMLDASEQARLLAVLRERQIDMGLGLILISHDLAVVRKVTDRILVLDAGRVVEEGPSNIVSSAPASATTRRLLDVAPHFAPVEGDALR